MGSVGDELVRELQEAASDAIDQAAEDLHGLSQDIWAHPELNYEEHHAHQVLTDFLEKYNFPVERNYIFKTGFRSMFGPEDDACPNVAVLSEYDALPEVGHACGHNLIAEVGVAAGLGIRAALKTARERQGKDIGRVRPT